MLSLESRSLPVSVCPLAVRRSLRALRYDRPLSDSALLALQALDDLGPADDSARALALRDLLASVAWSGLHAARRHHGVGEPHVDHDALSASAALSRLQRDFSVGSADLEAWSYLCYRYFVKSGRSLRDVAKILSTTNRTLERRLIAGHSRMAEALYERERQAIERSSRAAPDARAAGSAAPPAAPSDSSQAETITDYWRQRIAAASDGRRRLAERIVPIPLRLERDDGSSVAVGVASLAEALAAFDDPALLVLGPPGSGKSWLLRWLEYTLAAEALGGAGDRVPVMVELSRFQADEPGAHPPRPRDWLAARWAAQQPNLPPLERFMREGRVVFILDGLDEIPHGDENTYAQRLRAWKQFLCDDLIAYPGNRAVVSCRTTAYRVALSTAACPLPRVVVERLEPEGVRSLLARHNPERGDAVADIVLGGPLFGLARRPFMAALLAQPDIDLGHLTAGHAELLSRHVREALHREIANDNAVLTGGAVLTPHDVLRVLNARGWRTPWELPSQGPLFPCLAAFALHLLRRPTTSRTSCAPIAYGDALALLVDPAADAVTAADVLAAANALGVLEFDLERNEVRFSHQLWQAYFAARALVDDPTTPLAAALADLSAGGSPPAEETGWEDAVRFAAQMAPEPEMSFDRLRPA